MFVIENLKDDNALIALVVPKENDTEKHVYKFRIHPDGTVELDTYFEYDKTAGVPYRVVKMYSRFTRNGTIGLGQVPWIHSPFERQTMINMIKEEIMSGVKWETIVHD